MKIYIAIFALIISGIWVVMAGVYINNKIALLQSSLVQCEAVNKKLSEDNKKLIDRLGCFVPKEFSENSNRIIRNNSSKQNIAR